MKRIFRALACALLLAALAGTSVPGRADAWDWGQYPTYFVDRTPLMRTAGVTGFTDYNEILALDAWTRDSVARVTGTLLLGFLSGPAYPNWPVRMGWAAAFIWRNFPYQPPTYPGDGGNGLKIMQGLGWSGTAYVDSSIYSDYLAQMLAANIRKTIADAAAHGLRPVYNLWVIQEALAGRWWNLKNLTRAQFLRIVPEGGSYREPPRDGAYTPPPPTSLPTPYLSFGPVKVTRASLPAPGQPIPTQVLPALVRGGSSIQFTIETTGYASYVTASFDYGGTVTLSPIWSTASNVNQWLGTYDMRADAPDRSVLYATFTAYGPTGSVSKRVALVQVYGKVYYVSGIRLQR